MAEFFRVRDKRTNHEFTTARVTDNHEVLDKRALDARGKPLPAKPHTSIAKKAAAKPPSTTPITTTSTIGVEPAVIPEEGSQ